MVWRRQTVPVLSSFNPPPAVRQSHTRTMSTIWAPAPQPPTKLGLYRQLSPLAGVHVSPLQLGAMSIGDKWEKLGMGTMNKESSFALLDAFYGAGGNFIDTANNYQDESSEEFIGEWMETRGIRDQMVIATKYTTNYKRAAQDIPQKVHYTGNNIKALHISVEASLKKLRTDYIDILYLHWWDWETSVEEVMNGLHNLVTSGKVLYLGISDTPAWIVSKANLYARLMGKTPFVIYQGAWSILQRDFERDILPMARSEGLAIAPWNVLAAGRIRTDEEEERRRQTGENGRTLSRPDWERTEPERKLCKALEEVQKQVGAKSIQAVAIAYVMQKAPYVFPIVGCRKKEQLDANIEALDVSLSEEHIKYLEGVLPFDPGFPNSMVGDGTEYTRLARTAANFVKWPRVQAIRP
ncbi:Aldo/keto reductase [Ganoderma leucocontextum]|nr:Aldo/keto reductase [Ganoderma leucocontextum]